MYFINPWFLWFIPLIAVPFLLNLWRKKKVKDVEFSYFDLLMDSKIKNFTQIKIFNILLLLLRVLLLLFLIILMARPVFVGAILSDTMLSDSVTVYVVDNSKSMERSFKGGALLKRAKQIVSNNILSLPSVATCSLIFINDQGETKIIEAESNPEKLLAALKNIHIQNFKFNPKKMFSVADDFLKQSTKKPKRLFVYTDNQWGNWGGLNRLDISDEITVTFVMPFDIPTNGIGFVGYKLLDRLAKPNDKHAVVGIIQNFNQTEIKDVPIRFFVDGNMIDEVLVSIPPNGVIERTFYYRTISSEPIQKAELVIVYPDFLIDNNLRLILPVYHNKKVCVLGESIFVDTVIETYFKGDDRFIVSSTDDIDAGDIFVIPDYISDTESESLILDKLSSGGCGVIFYPPKVLSKEMSLSMVEKVSFHHPVLSPYKKMGKEGFEKIHYFPNKEKVIFDQVKNRDVLLADKKGNPLIEELTVRKGKLFIFNTDSKGKFSNIVNTEYFLPLFHRMMDYFLAYEAGMPDSFIEEIGADYSISDQKAFALKWVKPDKTSVSFNSIFVDGNYNIEAIKPSQIGYHKFIKDYELEKDIAFNIPFGEGDLTSVSKKQISKIFKNNKIRYTGMFAKVYGSTTQGSNNTVKILVLLCILLSLCELAVANMSG